MELEVFRGRGSLAARDIRAASRSRSSSLLRRSVIDDEVDVAMAGIDGLTGATAFGLQAVTRVAQAQAALELLLPAVSGRLNLIADDHAMGVADTLQDLRRRLRGI